MAVVRLGVVAALALTAGCRASEAGPSSGLTPPSGWRALPSLVTAAADAAKAAKVTTDAIEAWGDTSRGCYGAWLAFGVGARSPSAIADELVRGISSQPVAAGSGSAGSAPAIEVSDVVKPAANVQSGELSLAFSRAPYRGRVRAQIGKDGRVALLACFWNEREPAACEAACEQLLGSMRP